jgi:hypothetical protein
MKIVLPGGGFALAPTEAIAFVEVIFSLLLKRKRSGSLRPTSFPIARSSIFSTSVLIVGR